MELFPIGKLNNGKTGFSLGTNFWSGGVTNGDSQRTGILKLRSGDFRFQYENDGTPFQYVGLGDGNDSYRTAAAGIGIGDFSLGMNLFTGLRDRKSFKNENNGRWDGTKGKIGQTCYGDYGEKYTNGIVDEKNPYRLGALTLNYKGYRSGLNSEWIRHGFQNLFAHQIMSPQRMFQMHSSDWKPYSQYQTPNPFTSW